MIVSCCSETAWHASHLKHLDKGHAQVHICKISADQAETEKDSDWDDRTKVDSASHLDSLATIKKLGCTSHDLCHDSRKGEMPCCKDNRVV